MEKWKIIDLRVLTICRGGNVRSATLAYVLKYKYHVDAVACGHEGNSEYTRNLLCAWADYILVAEPYMREFIGKDYQYKTHVYEIGEDIWGMALHPDLIAKCDRLLQLDHNLLSQIDCRTKLAKTNEMTSEDKIQKREKILDEVVAKVVSGPIGEALNGMTVKELWSSLSKEDQYFLKMQMYQDKIIHDKNEFVDPTIKLDVRIE